MPLSNYSVFVGSITEAMDSPTALRKNPGSKPHYQILAEANGEKFRIAVNVKSDQLPSDLECYLDDNFKHPVLDHLKTLPTGLSRLSKEPNTAALDYVRGNLFDFHEMRILPSLLDGPSNDLNDIFDVHVKQAMQTEGALIYAFGARWGEEPHTRDQYFDYLPGNGIHDVHMNQGNTGSHAGDNGTYQDGGLFIYYPDENRWVAMFLKFQSQHVQTDEHADPIEPDEEPVVENDESAIKIFAAIVNPPADDVGMETVYLLNITNKSIDLNGWSIVDKLNKKETIQNLVLPAFDTVRIRLSGKGAQLSNQGGLISLLNKDGLKIHGVSYTKTEADKQDAVVQF